VRPVVNRRALGLFAIYVALFIAFGTVALVLGFSEDNMRSLIAIGVPFSLLILVNLEECTNKCNPPPGLFALSGIAALTFTFLLELIAHMSPLLVSRSNEPITSSPDVLAHIIAVAKAHHGFELALSASIASVAVSIASALTERYYITAISLFALLASTALVFGIITF